MEAHLLNNDSDYPMLDVTAPEVVDVSVRHDGSVLWVNVDGHCMLRICQIGDIVVNANVSFLPDQS